jgi:hypothetical protein
MQFVMSDSDLRHLEGFLCLSAMGGLWVAFEGKARHGESRLLGFYRCVCARIIYLYPFVFA